MKIEKILDIPNHKVFCFITVKGVFMREWIGSEDNYIDYGVIRIDYNIKDEDKFYYKK